MGLDMYLIKKIYVGAEYEHRKVTGEINISIGDEKLSVDFKKVSMIEERAGYWRKANAIHRWFVDNVQEGEDDCGEYNVSQENIKELLKTVNAILADHSRAPELLPPQDGFFFGTREYDQYYFDDLQHTKEILEAIQPDKNADYYYHSSW